MNVTYSAAVAADGDAIARIMSDWHDEVRWMPRLHAQVENLDVGQWLIEVTDVSVVRANGAVIGFLARQGRDIQALFIAPRARGQGVGRGLLALAKQTSARLGLWTFQANRRARRFYARNGFVADQMTDGRGNDARLPDVHMIWERSRT